MTITEIAKQFFEDCEEGKGWDVCKAYCKADATFSAQAEPLDGVKTLQQLNPILILVFFAHRCRDSTPNGGRLSTWPS